MPGFASRGFRGLEPANRANIENIRSNRFPPGIDLVRVFRGNQAVGACGLSGTSCREKTARGRKRLLGRRAFSTTRVVSGKHGMISSKTGAKFDFPAYFERRIRAVNDALDRLLPSATTQPATLHKAMRYSIFAGGKRVRPVLCLAAAEACGGRVSAALPLACAVECIHTYSLIHDDLPAMDDDQVRRGKPTCHVAFDEATAILAGDALLTLAFQVLASMKTRRPQSALEIIRIIAVAAGPSGMVQGQMLDMQSEGRMLSLEDLRHLHGLKTGAMIEAALVAGAIVAGGSPPQVEAIREYGRAIGLAFQVVDDILNVEGDPAVMGKAAGTDQVRRKNSFPNLWGLEKSREFAHNLIRAAVASLRDFGVEAEALRAIARYVIERNK
jgi:geranylgeranyl diphosphate synthase type II